MVERDGEFHGSRGKDLLLLWHLSLFWCCEANILCQTCLQILVIGLEVAFYEVDPVSGIRTSTFDVCDLQSSFYVQRSGWHV